MRDVIYINQANDHPGITLDKVNNKFEILGKSLPEDVNEFYDPIISWLREYAKDPNQKTDFIIKLEYYNSASVRKIVDILVILENIYKSGNDVMLHWLYEETDEMMGENGDDFKQTVNIPFNIQPYKLDEE